MAGNKNSDKGSGKPSSSFSPSSSSQVQPPPSTTSTPSAYLLATRLVKLVAHTMSLDAIIARRPERAAVRKLSELRDNIARIGSEHATEKPVVLAAKKSLYCADPVFIPFPGFQVEYELGPTQELEDVLCDTVSKLSAASVKASQLYTQSESAEEKAELDMASGDLVTLSMSFSKRIELLRQRREDDKPANVATPGSVDVERLMSAAVDKLSSVVKMLDAYRTGDKELKEVATSSVRFLEKPLFFFLRPKEGSQEVSSLKVDMVRYHRKLERRLDFCFLHLCSTMSKFMPIMDRMSARNALELLKPIDNVAETLWVLREVVRRRNSAIDEFCRLKVERSGMRTVKPTQETGENVESRGVNLSQFTD